MHVADVRGRCRAWAGRGRQRRGFCGLQRVPSAQAKEGRWAQGRVRAVALSSGGRSGLSVRRCQRRGVGNAARALDGWLRGRVLTWPLFLGSWKALLPLDRGRGACLGARRGGSEKEEIKP